MSDLTQAKTIQIFLPSGEPRGIRIAEITTRIVQVFEVPRPILQEFLSMPEGEQVAVYFLVGLDEQGEGGSVYIGQTSDLRTRLPKHDSDKDKDFWQRAFVLVSRTNSLTQTHALFLEWFSLQEAGKAGRFTIENGNGGSKPHTPPPLQADCLEIFATGRVLLSTLGVPLFDPVAEVGRRVGHDEFVCTASGADARGVYTTEGFVVLKGSIGRLGNVASIQGTNYERMRDDLLAKKVMVAVGDKVEFQQDHLFGSPSMAAIAVLGRSSNGWVEWKTEDGKTLDAVKRRKADADG
jgi:predicted GIY-YIG superfamily endonuclease